MEHGGSGSGSSIYFPSTPTARPAPTHNENERDRIEKEMEKQGLPLEYYPRVGGKIHRDKGASQRTPDKQQDLSDEEIKKVVGDVKKQVSESKKAGRVGR